MSDDTQTADHSAKRYEPELGQFLFGAPTGEFDVPDYGRALLLGLLNEIDRVYWNVNQKEWDRYDDPGIPGIDYRSYWWGDGDAPEASLPNLKTGTVEIRWYKHPGRGLSVNRAMDPAEWAAWFQEAYQLVLAADHRLDGGTP